MNATRTDFERLVAHYRTELVKARGATTTTGEGVQLYEGLMNAALDDLARFFTEHPSIGDC